MEFSISRLGLALLISAILIYGIVLLGFIWPTWYTFGKKNDDGNTGDTDQDDALGAINKKCASKHAPGNDCYNIPKPKNGERTQAWCEGYYMYQRDIQHGYKKKYKICYGPNAASEKLCRMGTDCPKD